MIAFQSTSERLLALDPCHRGIGFVVLDPDSRLADWGVYRVGNDRLGAAVGSVRMLIQRYHPKRIVVECMESTSGRRGKRAKEIIAAVAAVADEYDISISHYTVTQVQAVFARWNVIKKEARTSLLAERFPVLQLYRPPHRRPWKSEDPRMAIFDAMSFAVTHLVIAREDEETKLHIPF